MSSTLDRIATLQAEAQAAIEAATTTAALEEARIHFLGRKAELPNLLRGVAQLAPEERAATGKAANQARQAVEAALAARTARWPVQSSRRGCARTASTSPCPPPRRPRSAGCT